jgi:predicted nucleic-acid-binding protein
MVGLDTNVLVRYIMQDDTRQSPKAAKLLESLSVEEPGFVSLVSVVELGWVLSSSYDLDREQIAQALELMMRTAASAGCTKTMTFDVGAAKAASMTLIQ